MSVMSIAARLGVVVGVGLLAFGCITVPQNAFVPEQSAAAKAGAAPAKAPRATARAKPSSTVGKRPASISAEALGIYRTPAEMHAPPSEDELSVVESAETLIGKAPESTVVVNGRQFVLDCVGTVAAVYYGVNIDITKDFPQLSGNGVERLYKSLATEKVLHSDKYPRPGDVVIWNNTWDANANGDTNDDPRTHAGVVLAVDEDGTIHYVHENYRRGVIIEVMNLLKPDVYQDANGRILNSPMAMAPKPGETRAVHWVSGDLFDTFGDVLGARVYYRVAAGDAEALNATTALVRTP